MKKKSPLAKMFSEHIEKGFDLRMNKSKLKNVAGAVILFPATMFFCLFLQPVHAVGATNSLSSGEEWLSVTDKGFEAVDRFSGQMIDMLIARHQFFDLQSAENAKKGLLRQFNLEKGNGILISRNMTKFAKFKLVLDENKEMKDLVIDIYEKDFVENFRKYGFDPAAWNALIKDFNSRGTGKVAEGKKIFKMKYDYKDEKWNFSIALSR